MLTGDVTNLILDALIAVLLCVTIAYCWVLNHRIKILQDSRGELALLLKHFDDSTKRASDSIIALQTASKKIGEGIQFRIEKANYLLDDLAFMIEKGEKTANKLEASFAVNRARDRVVSEKPPERQERPEWQDKPLQSIKASRQSEPESELEEKPSPPAWTAEKVISSREKTAASLEAVLDRVVERSKTYEFESPSANGAKSATSSWPPQNKLQNTSDATSPARPASSVRSRSKAEQELLDMIKTGIKS